MLSDDPKMSVGFLSNQLARLMSNALAQSLQPIGLAPAQFATLLQLWREDGLTQRDLVDRLHVEQATIASTLNRMERDGLIIRKPHLKDSRAQYILLTSRGRELQAPAMREARQVSQSALAILEGEERAQLLDLMHRVVEHMKSVRSKAP